MEPYKMEVMQNYLSNHMNVIFSQKEKPLFSFQKNMKKIYAYLRKQNVDVIFMQYPLANIDILKYVLSVEKMEMANYNKYRDAVIERWKPPSFRLDKNIKFLENKDNFKAALRRHSFDELFIDRFAIIFGHTSNLGHELIADNVMGYLEKNAIYPTSLPMP